MENFRLKVFRVVAEKLNFTQAAEALYLTQPAVTLQIKALEQSLGTRLFDRVGGHIALTPAGEVLLRYAREIEALTARAEYEVHRLSGEESGKLALGASTTIAQYLLPRLAGDFAAANPRIELSILGANTEHIVAALVEERITLGLIEGPPGRADVKAEDFINDELFPIASVNHEWAAPEALHIKAAQLASAPLILRERGSGTRHVVEQALKAAGLKLRNLRVVIELDSTEAIKSAVEAGLGIGFVSQWALIKERRLGTLKTFRVEGLSIRRQFQLLYARGPEPVGPAGAFLRFARERRQRIVATLPPAD